MSTRTEAVIEDLYRLPDGAKAEIVDGEIIFMSPTGDMPGRAAGAIYASLRAVERTAGGRAYPDNVGFRVDLPRRKSFSPDAAFFVGEPAGMRFLEGVPIFAVEVRSEGDYGRDAEVALTAKRADYFAAGALIVWDVDLLSDDVIRSYHRDYPEDPRVFRRGDVARADAAVPGWTIPVNDLFA